MIRAELKFVLTFFFLFFCGASNTFAVSNNVKIPVGWNDGKRAIARDILAAYSSDLEQINLIADNADYALLSLAVYEDDKNANQIESNIKKILKQRSWEEEACNICTNNNLIAGDTVSRLYRNSKTQQQVLAFRGTNGLLDWVTNIKGTTDDIEPLSTAQLSGARDIARLLAKKNISNLTFVGHSLGGRLASIAKFETGKKSVIFNSAPIGKFERNIWPSIDSTTKKILSFRAPDDPLKKLSKFEDLEIRQIYNVDAFLAEDIILSFYDKQYREQVHGIATIADVMQAIRLARDDGWISAYIAEKNGTLVTDSVNVTKTEQRKQDSSNVNKESSNVITESTPNSEVDQNKPNTNEAGASFNSGMINIDFPTELKVNCGSKKPGFTDIIISVNGLEQNKAYDLLLKGYGLGYRYIYPNRTNEPKIYKNAYAGHYIAEVWLERGSIKNQKLIASKAFTITRPQPELTAPVNVAENAPIKITLSNVISPFRNHLFLTVVPVNYHLKRHAELRRVANCKPAEHAFRGLPSGQYEARLINTGLRETTLVAKKPITVTGK